MNIIVELGGVPGAMECLEHTEKRMLSLISKSGDDKFVTALATFLQQLSAVRLQILKPNISEQRSTIRARERGVALVKFADLSMVEATVHDISIGGAFIECDELHVSAGDFVSLYLPGFADQIRAEVRSCRDYGIHLAFAPLEPSQAVALMKRLERYFARH